MKTISLVLALAVLSVIFAQSLERPQVLAKGANAKQTRRNALAQYLGAIFPENGDSGQKWLQERILSKASVYVLKGKLRKSGGIVKGEVIIDAPKILDAIAYSDSVHKNFLGQNIHFANTSGNWAKARGFFGKHGFRVHRNSPPEDREIREALDAENWRRKLSAIMHHRRCALFIESKANARGAQISAYNASGREFSSFCAPLERQKSLEKLYSRGGEELVCYRLLEDIIRQSLKWKIMDEHFLELRKFSAEQQSEIRKLLARLKTNGTITWIGAPSEVESLLRVDICCRKGVDFADLLSEQLKLRFASFFYAIDYRQQQGEIVFSRHISPWPILVTIAIALLLLLAYYRRRIRKPIDEIEELQPNAFLDETIPLPAKSKPPVSGGVIIENSELDGNIRIAGGNINFGDSRRANDRLVSGVKITEGKLKGKIEIAGGDIVKGER